MNTTPNPTGPITVIINSGSGLDQKQLLRDRILETLAQSGRKSRLVEIDANSDFLAICDKLVKEAKQQDGLMVAAGGDGTVSALAGLCCKHKVALGVIPLGTFNYFARELLIPVDPIEAANVLITGKIRSVSAGFVQERIFLNNASFGLYTKIIRRREEASSRFGRMRIVATLSAIASLFQGRKLFSIKLISARQEIMRKTPMVFVGNNTLQLDNLGLDVARCTLNNQLAVVIMKQTSRLETARMLLRGMIKNLKDESKLEEFCANGFDVETKQKSIDLVIDGEIVHVKTPLSFRVEANALQVMAPL